jgi:hypothetical protein
MSGAAAISAAKNRRGNSAGQLAPPVQTNVRNQVVTQNISSPPNGSQPNSNSNGSNDSLPKPSNPMQALQLHEIRLNRNDKAYLELEKSVKLLSEVVSKNQQAQQQQAQQHQQAQQQQAQQHQQAQQQQAHQQQAQQQPSTIVNTQVDERLSQLEELFNHLKEDIFRIQAFVMETNLAFLKYQSIENAKSVQVPVPALPQPVPVPALPLPEPVPALPLPEPVIDEPNVSLQINDYTLDQIVDISQ